MLLKANLLQEKGLESGDRVLVFVPMSVLLYQVLLALFYTGLPAVFVDAWAERDRLDGIIRKVKPQAMIGPFKSRILGLLSPEIRKIPHFIPLKSLSAYPKVEKPELDKFCPDFKNKTALVTFTTGSTGRPKGVSRSHHFLLAQHEVLSDHLNLKAHDVDMPTLPMFVLNNLASGLTSVLPCFNPMKPSTVSPALIFRQINEFCVTSTTGSPAFFEKLADWLLSNDKQVNLRTLFVGGAMVTPSLAQKMVRAFPESQMTVLYGATEAEPISSVSVHKVASSDASKGLLVGKPIKQAKVELIRFTQGHLELAQNESLADFKVSTGDTGEIVVSGKHVLPEYMDSPDDFRLHKIVAGNTIWHRTGDEGFFDKSGNLYLRGRRENRFKKEGIWYSPFLIESKIITEKDINRAAVMEFNGKIYCFVELQKMRKYKNSLSRAGIALSADVDLVDEYIILSKIPLDPRHDSRINYNKLSKWLKKNVI